VLTLRLTRVAREPQGAIEDVPDLDAGQGEEAGSERRGRDGVSLAAVIETIAGQSGGGDSGNSRGLVQQRFVVP
jgi:hypothetical protein